MKKHLLPFLCVLVAAPSASWADGSLIRAQEKIASYKVLTTQYKTKATAIINNMKRVAEAQMGALAMLNSSVAQMELYKEYSPIGGQGAQTCDAVNQSTDITRIARLRQQYDLGNVSSAGQMAFNPTKYVQAQVKEQLDKYCTADQHNLGLCRAKYDGMAGASSNYASLMQHEQFTVKQLEAANHFIANLLPAPAPLSLAQKSCGARCDEVAHAYAEQNSFSSLVAHSFASNFGNRVGTKTYAPIQ